MISQADGSETDLVLREQRYISRKTPNTRHNTETTAAVSVKCYTAEDVSVVIGSFFQPHGSVLCPSRQRCKAQTKTRKPLWSTCSAPTADRLSGTSRGS